jgi:hypothetical protein
MASISRAHGPRPWVVMLYPFLLRFLPRLVFSSSASSPEPCASLASLKRRFASSSCFCGKASGPTASLCELAHIKLGFQGSRTSHRYPEPSRPSLHALRPKGGHRTTASCDNGLESRWAGLRSAASFQPKFTFQHMLCPAGHQFRSHTNPSHSSWRSS